MIGDLILELYKKIKQTFCIHEYKSKYVNNAFQIFEIKTCKKCGRKKIKKI